MESAEMISSMYKGIFLFVIIFYTIAVILLDIGKATCLKKAGEEPWKRFIPFYNTCLMYKIVGLKGFFVSVEIAQFVIAIIMLVILDILSLILAIFYAIKISKVFGKVELT